MAQTIGRFIMERQAQTTRLHELLKDANLACGQDYQGLGGTGARSSLTFRLFLCFFLYRLGFHLARLLFVTLFT